MLRSNLTRRIPASRGKSYIERRYSPWGLEVRDRDNSPAKGNEDGWMVAGRFKASWWLPGGHSQTLWPVLTRRVPLDARTERLELPDGDFVRLDWVGQRGPMVIVLPGLQGDIESAYVRGLLRACEARGWRGVLLNYRGHGEPNRQMRSYHCGMTCDLHHLVHHLAEREPNTPIGVVGYSVGANISLKWLGECGQRGQSAAGHGGRGRLGPVPPGRRGPRRSNAGSPAFISGICCEAFAATSCGRWRRWAMTSAFPFASCVG